MVGGRCLVHTSNKVLRRDVEKTEKGKLSCEKKTVCFKNLERILRFLSEYL